MTNSLNAERIVSLSSAAAQGLRVEVLASTASTNADLRLLAPMSELPLLLATENQTAGRGRAGRSWRSVAGDSLCFSLAWRFAGSVQRLSGLSLAVGVALAGALQSQGWPVQLKWPNDVLLNGAKLAGILIETVSPPPAAEAAVWAITGIGINVHPNQERDAELDGKVSSLGDMPIDRNQLLAAIADALSSAMTDFDREGLQPFIGRWHALHAYQDQSVSIIENGQLLHEGIARGIDDGGRLQLDTHAGRIVVTAGDVSLRPAGVVNSNALQSDHRFGTHHAATD